MTLLDQFLWAASLRAAVVLAATACVAMVLVLCRTSAANRHRAWSFGLAGALAVPALMAMLPALSVPVPEWQTAQPDAFEAAEADAALDSGSIAWVPRAEPEAI